MVKFEVTHFQECPLHCPTPKMFFVNIVIKEYSQDFYNYVLNFCKNPDEKFFGFNECYHNYGEPMNIHRFENTTEKINLWLDDIRNINL